MDNIALFKLNELISHTGSPKLSAFKRALKQGQATLKQQFFEKMPILSLLQGRAYLVDQLLIAAWKQHKLPINQGLCLIPIGGYGREKLHPLSDIDILILSDETSLSQHQTALEKFITFLWDMGLHVGHSMRSLAECLDIASQDITVMTSLLDARFLVGDPTLYDNFIDAIQPQHLWPKGAFFKAKLKEQRKRHQTYANTSYNLEPNIKEGPGGLRDIHTLVWVAKRHFNISGLKDFIEQGFISKEEYEQINEGLEYLWRLRTALHYLTNRKEERLLFDHQMELAKEFEYKDLPGNLAIEQFMTTYYRAVKELNELNDVLLQYFQEVILNTEEASEPVILNERFQVRNGYIRVNNDNVFKESPSALIEIFLLMAQHPDIKGVRASTIRLIRQHRHLVETRCRYDKTSQQFFITLFREASNVGNQLRYMNRYGVLGRYLPAFGNIIGQMQYDLFHLYTVDRHLIFMVRHIYFLTQIEAEEDYPLCHELILQLPKLDLLYLAALFHDIGKGCGGDHSDIGSDIVNEFAKTHGLLNTDANLLAWLVKNHLIMSTTAQQMDIYDPDIIETFADKVVNKNTLDYLYLLTCADIYATNEKLWNSWRDSLLKNLYFSTKAHFEQKQKTRIEHSALIAQIQQEALTQLSQDYGKQTPSVMTCTTLWNAWAKPYFLRNSAKTIAWHTHAILAHQDPEKPLILVSEQTYRGGIEIFIYQKAESTLFARLTTLLDRLSLNITEAQIITTKNEFTLNSFTVLKPEHSQLAEEEQINIIQSMLQEQLSHQHNMPSLSRRRTPRRLRHFSSPTEIHYKTDQKHGRTLLEITTPDRPGLLAQIGRALVDCDLELQNAKITTLGERVQDVFFITDSEQQPLDEARQETLKAALLGRLTVKIL